MFLRKMLTATPEKQELSRQQPLEVSAEPADELLFHPPNQPQLNQSQVPYPQNFNTSLNSSSVFPNS